ncbi:MAG TPA: hypothetical protein VJZ00_10480 [Thermoanaerobaculia bacterium]|nr:hypothetical protein [Thermoanaerobaculia bacterium]
MRKLLFLLTLFAATSLFAADEMKKLDFLVGEWKGEAWFQMGPKREYVYQTESVKPKLGGKVLLVEGLGKRKNENGSIGDVVHDALAVLSWDESKNTYRFSTYTAQYGAMETTLDVTAPNVGVWSMDVPGGKMRYTMRLTEKGEWNEVGEFTRDNGANWMKFFEMTLSKK